LREGQIHSTKHPSLLRTIGFSAISTYDSYFPSIFGKKCSDLMLFSKYLGGPFFEVIEVKRGHMVKEWDFEVEKI
jgi:hypothetical protein